MKNPCLLPLILIAGTVAFAIPQSGEVHELNNCEVDVRSDVEPPVTTVKATESSPPGDTSDAFTVEFLLGAEASTIAMNDHTRSGSALTVRAYKRNSATFTYDPEAGAFDLTLSNEADTLSFTATHTTGSFYEHGPLSYGKQEVRGPGGGVGAGHRSVLIWFENRGLKSGFTLTDI